MIQVDNAFDELAAVDYQTINLSNNNNNQNEGTILPSDNDIRINSDVSRPGSSISNSSGSNSNGSSVKLPTNRMDVNEDKDSTNGRNAIIHSNGYRSKRTFRNDFNIDVTERLIRSVSLQPALYDLTHPFYKDHTARYKAWNDIAADINLPVSECQSKWSTLRRCLANARKRQMKRRAKSQNSNIIKKWRYQDEMAFLFPFLDIKETGYLATTTVDQDLSSYSGANSIAVNGRPAQLQGQTSDYFENNSEDETVGAYCVATALSSYSPTVQYNRNKNENRRFDGNNDGAIHDDSSESIQIKPDIDDHPLAAGGMFPSYESEQIAIQPDVILDASVLSAINDDSNQKINTDDVYGRCVNVGRQQRSTPEDCCCCCRRRRHNHHHSQYGRKCRRYHRDYHRRCCLHHSEKETTETEEIEIESFFVSMAKSVERLSRGEQLRIKTEIFKIVTNAEIRYLEKQQQQRTSTIVGSSRENMKTNPFKRRRIDHQHNNRFGNINDVQFGNDQMTETRTS